MSDARQRMRPAPRSTGAGKRPFWTRRQMVERLIGKENVGKVIIEREEGKEPTSPVGEPPQQEKRAQGQGS